VSDRVHPVKTISPEYTHRAQPSIKAFLPVARTGGIKVLITGLTGMSLDGHCIGSFTLRLSKFC
jgi:hypothetical protein